MRRVVQGCSIGLLILNLCLFPFSVLWAQEVVVVDFTKEKEGIPQGWQLSENEGKAELALVEEDSVQVLRMRSNSSSFSLQKDVEINLKQTPFLVWQWKVTELPDGGDFRKKTANDQAAQLLVVFRWAFFRKEVIAYIWDSTAPKGTTGDDPSSSYVPFLTVKMVVIESGGGERGRWITETRNVAEDYKKLFGDAPDKVVGVRIQINSQHTKSQAESYWRSVVLKARP